MSTRSPFPRKPHKQSPFPEPSLPQAGESSREALLDLAFDKLLFPVWLASGFLMLVVVEWMHALLHTPPMPWFATAVLALAAAFAAWRFVRLKPIVERLRQGVRGEREVGRMLEDVRAQGYRVYHDLPGQGDGGPFNVDHLLIGPAGVFAVETKTISKPASERGGRATVDYSGERVRVGGFEPDRDPIAQAEALARFVGGELQRQTGRRVDVRGVVLYPGWWVNEPKGEWPRVWVLNPERLARTLSRQPLRLSDPDIALYADRIERMLRTA